MLLSNESKKLDPNSVKCTHISIKKELLCCCNSQFEKHDNEVTERYLDGDYKNDKAEWNYACTIDDGPTDAFGEVLFLGLEKTSKYVKVSRHTEIKHLLELLFSKSHWNLKQPKLLISITGGTNINLKPKFKDQFCKGLVKAAMNTGS